MTPHVTNGMPAEDLGRTGWHKPWSGPNGGTCLEVKRLPGQRVALRQSADEESPALICPLDGFAAFIEAVKDGQADYLLTPEPAPAPAPAPSPASAPAPAPAPAPPSAPTPTEGTR